MRRESEAVVHQRTSAGGLFSERGAHSGSHWDQAFQKAQTVLAILKAAITGQHHWQDPLTPGADSIKEEQDRERAGIDITNIRWFSPHIYNNFTHGI